MTSKRTSTKTKTGTSTQSGTFDWVETATGRWIIIRKKIGGSGWSKISEVRSEFWAIEMVRLLRLGQADETH